MKEYNWNPVGYTQNKQVLGFGKLTNLVILSNNYLYHMQVMITGDDAPALSIFTH